MLVGISALKFLSMKSFINFISNNRKHLINKLNSIFNGWNTEPIGNNKTHKIERKSPKEHCLLLHIPEKKKNYLMKNYWLVKQLQ